MAECRNSELINDVMILKSARVIIRLRLSAEGRIVYENLFVQLRISCIVRIIHIFFLRHLYSDKFRII